jgi:hypothetical protein
MIVRVTHPIASPIVWSSRGNTTWPRRLKARFAARTDSAIGAAS